MYVPAACVQVPEEARRGCLSSELPNVELGTRLDPLEEQCALKHKAVSLAYFLFINQISSGEEMFCIISLCM